MTCFVFAAILQVLDAIVSRNQGIPLDYNPYVIPMRYLPTLCLVAIGLVWKSVLGDIKRIMPWSAMSADNEATAENSVLLNYVGKVEVLSLFESFKRKHWALSLGLIVGFLLGVSVTAANSLTYSELSAEISHDATLRKTTGFDFHGTLVTPNGSLTIASDHVGNQPYGAVSAQRVVGGPYTSWTSGKYVFESFQLADDQVSVQGADLDAEVSSFAASFDCKPLDYSWTLGSPDSTMETARQVSFIANQTIDECVLSVYQEREILPNSTDPSPRGWLNITSCLNEPKDMRILATVASPLENSTAPVSNNTLDISVSGMVCSPAFTMQQARVRASAGTGEIRNFEILPETLVAADIKTPVEAIWQYLSNPTTANMDWWRARQWGPFDNETEKIFNLTQTYAYWQRNDDFFEAFFQGVDQDKRRDLVNQPAEFKSELESLASNTIAQVVNFIGRSNSSEELGGGTVWNGPRLLLRDAPLRVLQAIFVFIGLTGILLATLLRPRSDLHRDPGSLAQTAVIMSASHDSTEEAFVTHSRSSNMSMANALQGTRFKLHPETGGVSLAGQQFESDRPTQSIAEEIRPSKKPNKGWKPLAFRLDVRSTTILAFVTTMVTLGILQSISQTHSGLCRNTDTAARIYSFVPTLILVLLSYACSGVDGTVRSMNAYKSLSNPSKKQPLLLNYREYNFWASEKLTSKRHNLGFAVVASSIALVLFPVIKIIAAGLYETTVTTYQRDVVVNLDASLPENLESTFSADDPSEMGSRFAEWARIPMFNLGERPGILGNLVFSNISGVVDELDYGIVPGDSIELPVPAVLVDVNCTALSNDVFNFKAATASGFDDDYMYYRIECSSPLCEGFLSSSYDAFGGYRFQGRVYSPTTAKFGIALSDFGSPYESITNLTLVEDGDIIQPGDVDIALPTTRGAMCSREMRLVEVNVTFTQKTQRGLNDAVTVLPWSPSHFDRESLVFKRKLEHVDDRIGSLLPIWYSPDSQSFLNSNDSLWPTETTSLNFFELLATYAEYEAKNLSSLLDTDGFARATTDMFTAYTVQLLTELRPAAAGTPRNANATIAMQRERISQHLASTVVVEALLASVLCCLAWIALRFPRSAILPKDPDSVAARFSLLAGSRLVQRLREDPSARQRGDGIWSEKSGLGWWPTGGSEGTWRWGIDVGDDMVKQDWKHPPAEASAGETVHSTSEEALDVAAFENAGMAQTSSLLAADSRAAYRQA
ncbi:hypothetical protein SLS58_010944 [Diplodia intermedia]|uniref:Uncharacterized protein n=1 Tax=Diplodia intermedia TaxID=856260 RepID=A0ABR3T2H1_9PEZI